MSANDANKTQQQLVEEITSLRQQLQFYESQQAQGFFEQVLNGISDGISVLDTHLRIIYHNATLAKHHEDDTPLTDKACYQCYQNRTSPCQHCPALETLQTGQPADREVEIVGGSQGPYWVYLFTYPLKDSQGRTTGIIEHMRDITRRKQMEHQLAQRNSFQKALLAAIPVPVFYKDTQLRYLGCNPQLCQFTGTSQEEIIGKTPEEVWPQAHARFYTQQDQQLLTDPQQAPLHYTGQMVDAQGRSREVLFAKNIITDSRGQVLGIVCSFVDISEQKQLQQKLERNSYFLEKAQQIAHIGSWSLDFATNRLHWSDEVFRIFGLQPGSIVPSYDMFLAYVHADDRDKLQQAFQQSLTQDGPYEFTHRIVRPSGEIRTVEERGSMYATMPAKSAKALAPCVTSPNSNALKTA